MSPRSLCCHACELLMVGAVLVFIAWVIFTPLPVKGDGDEHLDPFFCGYPIGNYDYTIVQLDLVVPDNATDKRFPCLGASYDEADMYNKRVDTGGHPKCKPQIAADYGIRYGCEWRDGVLTYLVIPMPEVIQELARWRGRIVMARHARKRTEEDRASAMLDDL